MTATLSQKHPQWTLMYPDWELMRDANAGERQVKIRRTKYLPYTPSQIADGVENYNQKGWRNYDSYLMRARFPGFVDEAVQTAVGMLHSEPSKIELPEAMKDIRSSRGEDMHQLLRRISEEQLITGRIGLLADLPSSGGSIPYIASYATERVINWDDGLREQNVPQKLNLVVLDESEDERKDDFTWEREEKYRVLVLGSISDNEQAGVYRAGVYRDEQVGFSEEGLIVPNFRGRTLDEIPFVFVNSVDLVTQPDKPPLLDLGNLCMTIYRGEADYRQNLFMQGQDTLVIIGGQQDEEDELRTGAGARISVPMGGDAKYIGVESDGLSEQREALNDDRSRAGSMGAQSLDTVSRERESGKSLGIRIAARTADLNQIALTGAAGLQQILRITAKWMNENPESVVVKPNLEFGESELTGQSMVEMQTSRNIGFPISAQSLHKLAQERGLTSLTFEEEMAQSEREKDTVFAKAETGDRDSEQTSEGNSDEEESEGSDSDNEE